MIQPIKSPPSNDKHDKHEKRHPWLDVLFGPFREVFNHFIEKRIPKQKIVTLQQRQIYIFPNKYGFIMLWVILALFLAGVNYSNSIMLGLGYLMASFFIMGILHTYRNVAGLTIEPSHAHNGFAGDTIMLDISISKTGRRHYESVRFIWDDVSETASLIDHDEAVVHLLIPVKKRGLYQPDRLRIETNYPIGLFVCWAYVRFDIEAWVYPKPEKNEVTLQSPYTEGHDAVSRDSGTDDFAGLRRYEQGDSLKHVDWKAFARGDELYTKTFVDSVDQDVWIDWQSFGGFAQEAQLSYMCYWVLKFSEMDRYFGLKLPYTEVELGRGERHKVRCLLALAQA